MAWFGSLMSALGSGAAAGGTVSAAGAAGASAASGAASALGSGTIGGVLQGIGNASGSTGLSNIGGILNGLNKGGSPGIPQIDQPGTPKIYSNLNPPNQENEFIKMMNSLTQMNRRY